MAIRSMGKGLKSIRDRLKDIKPKPFQKKPNLLEKLGGSEKGKPHSTEEGRIASGRRRLKRFMGRGREKLTPGERDPFTRPQPGGWPKRKPMVPLGHGGSPAQQHYLQHGYGPHKIKMAKASDKAVRGNKLTKKSFA